MHEKTPIPEMKPVLKVVLVLMAVSGYSLFVLLAYCIFSETDKILAGVLTLVIPPFICAALIIPLVKMTRSYAEFDEKSVRVVDYYTFSKKETSIPRTEVVLRENGVAGSDCFGRWLNIPLFRSSVRYIVFKNASGEYLFKILETPEGIKWADALMNK